jgi:hypothetical protein
MKKKSMTENQKDLKAIALVRQRLEQAWSASLEFITVANEIGLMAKLDECKNLAIYIEVALKNHGEEINREKPLQPILDCVKMLAAEEGGAR